MSVFNCNVRVTFFFIIGTTIVALGESLKCYNCIEGDEDVTFPIKVLKPVCERPFEMNDNNPTCTGDYCTKGTVTFKDITTIERQCVTLGAVLSIGDPDDPSFFSKPITMEVGPLKRTTYLCNEDFCNSASLPTTAIPFIILLLMTLFFV